MCINPLWTGDPQKGNAPVIYNWLPPSQGWRVGNDQANVQGYYFEYHSSAMKVLGLWYRDEEAGDCFDFIFTQFLFFVVPRVKEWGGMEGGGGGGGREELGFYYPVVSAVQCI